MIHQNTSTSNLLCLNGAPNSLHLSSHLCRAKKIKQMSKVLFRVRKTPTCAITSCAKLHPALKNRAVRELWVVLEIRVCYETSNHDLFKKHSRLFFYSTNKRWWWLSHREKNTRTNSASSTGMWKTRGLFRREKWDRRGRNDMVCMHGVCLPVYNHVCMCLVFYCFFFSACLFIHLPLSLRICQSQCVRRASVLNFGRHLQSVFCARFVFLSFSLESIPPPESHCQLCEVKLSQILWNQLNMHRGLM